MVNTGQGAARDDDLRDLRAMSALHIRRRLTLVRLSLLSSRRFWSVLAAGQGLVFQIRRRSYTVGSSAVDVRRDTRVTGSILWQAAPTALFAALLLTITELVGAALAGLPEDVPLVADLAKRLNESDYVPLLLATTAFGATLLGLYFTALSLVVSTGYARAAAGVRALVVTEPGGASYSRLVGLLVAASLYLLAAGYVGYRPPALSLVSLAFLGAAAVLALLFLGPRAFQMFDPVALAVPLLRAFREWSLRAADGEQGQAFEEYYRARAAAVLDTYRQLIELALAARATDQVQTLHGSLCRLWIEYAVTKPRIRAESHWFERRQISANWLRSDDAEIGVALETGSGLQPRIQIERLWVEKQIAATLATTISAGLHEGDDQAAYELAVPLSSLARVLAGALQTDAALLALGVLTGPRAETASGVRQTGSIGGKDSVIQPKILDAQGLIVVNMVLGVRTAADRLVDQGLWPQVTRAIKTG